MKIVATAAVIGLAMAVPASGQSLADRLYNAGANFGMAQRLSELCPRYKISPSMRRRFTEVSRPNKALFQLGREDGRDKIDDIQAEQTEEDIADAMACLSAALLFGPHGSVVANVLVEDRKVAAREERERNKREAEKIAGIKARKDEPAPADDKDGDLIIEEHEEQPDKLAGRYTMSLKTIEHDGKQVQVG